MKGLPIDLHSRERKKLWRSVERLNFNLANGENEVSIIVEIGILLEHAIRCYGEKIFKCLAEQSRRSLLMENGYCVNCFRKNADLTRNGHCPDCSAKIVENINDLFGGD